MIFAQVSYAQSCIELTGCAKKICELEVKLKTVSEQHAVARIQTALSQTKSNCTDEKVAAHDMVKSNEHQIKIDHKINEAKEDIAEAKLKQQKAQAEGKLDKVHKYQNKIEEKQLKIQHLETEK